MLSKIWVAIIQQCIERYNIAFNFQFSKKDGNDMSVENKNFQGGQRP